MPPEASLFDPSLQQPGEPGLPPELAGKWRPQLGARRAWLRDLPARLMLRLSNHPRVRPGLGRRYQRARDAHAGQLPKLSPLGERIVDALERDGVFVTTLGELQLAGSHAAFTLARTLADRFAPDARRLVAGGKDFVFVPPERIVAHPLIFDWGVQSELLDIVENYLGLPVAYDGVCINYTVADGRAVSTRKWHRDWEDRRMLKVAVYLNDVDADGGPFELIRHADPGQDDEHGFDYVLADDAVLEQRLGEPFADQVVSCTGPAGTVVFADTARFFHRGKPATARDRAAVFYSYVARQPRHPFFCERSGMSRQDVATLARRLPERQRAAAEWRRFLPLRMRLIPSARL